MSSRLTAAPVAVLLAALLVLGVPAAGWSHAFPDHSDPRVGHTLDTPPSSVRIWFDGDIEPVFSTIHVESAARQRVDQGDAQVDPHDATLLEVSLPPLPSGTYLVFWSAVARDGHRTEGSFPFHVK